MIFDQHEVIQGAEIVARSYEFEPNANYALVGLRRAGKSTMLYKIARDLVAGGAAWCQIIYVNFEDDRLLGFTSHDFADIVEIAYELAGSRQVYFFLDEIQIVDGWEHFARRLADQGHRAFITGSNAKMLSSEIASTLGGRYIQKMIMPFSFSEVLDYKGTPHDSAAMLTTSKAVAVKTACKEYLKHGGLPEALRMRDKREYIKSVYEHVLLGDIIEREKVKNKLALRLMVKKIAETVMSEVSFSTLAGNIKASGVKTSTDSMIEYASHAERAFLLFRTRNFVASFAEKEGLPRFYFFDNGLLSLFLLDKPSALLENAVALHLKRNAGEEIYYYKSRKTGVDVDFFLPESGTAIQVAYSLAEAEEREVKSLVTLAEKVASVKHLVIVTSEEKRTITRGEHKIDVVPIDEFLADGGGLLA